MLGVSRILLRHIRLIILILSAVIVPVVVQAASFVPPRDMGELASLSDAVVLARADDNRTVQRGSLLFTQTSFYVVDVVQGPLKTADRIDVDAPGGEMGDVGWAVPGSPKFATGEVYLLFLNRHSSGVWKLRMLSYGLLRRMQGRNGTSLLIPLPEAGGLQPFPRPDSILPDPIGSYQERPLLEHLRQVVLGQVRWESNKVLAPSNALPPGPSAVTPPSGCAFMSGAGLNIRWKIFETGGSLSVSATAGGDPSLPDGGFPEVEGAIQAWMSIPNTSLNLTYGGTMSYAMPCSSPPGQNTPPSGTNVIVFNDPCNDMPDLNHCAGTLAYGGPWYSSSTHTFDGSTWRNAVGWFVVVNNGVGCLGTTNYRRMITHELGHGLGFGHVSDPGALMYAYCCNDFNNTDISCVQYLYPGGGGGGVPSAPTLSAPADGETNISTSPTLTWNLSSGADSYRLQVSMSSDFGTTVVDQSNITVASYDAGGFSTHTTYYWRVNASNAQGTSGWSSVWNFATTTGAPNPPTLALPSNNQTNVATSPTLSWNSSSGATSYQLQVSESSGFGTTVVDQSNITNTSYNAGGLSTNTQYYWRLKASNAQGTSGWSSVWNFSTIQGTPRSPTLASPANAATGIMTNATLSWNTSSGASSYGIQVSTTPTSATTLADTSGIAGTTYSASGFSNNVTYYWRVNATNSFGTSGWSSVWSFTTIAAVGDPPILVSPLDNTAGAPTNVALSWNGSAGALSYRVQVSSAANFHATVLDRNGITNTSLGVSGLSNNAKYYWRVNTTNSAGTSGWSNVWSFTTIVATPSVPTLVSPLNGASGVPTNPRLSWDGSGGSNYRLQVSESADFSRMVYDTSGISGKSQVLTGLIGNTTYYWRVNAANGGGTSDWSATWSFATAIPIPYAPTLVSPSDGAVGLRTSVNFVWNAPAGATSYGVQVSTSSTFASFLIDTAGLAQSSFGIDGLSNDAVYYWRVNASSAGGASGWSAVWSFRTTLGIPSVPILAAPLDGANGVSVNPPLSWNPSSFSPTYRVQVSLNSGFGTTGIDSSGINGISLLARGLANDTKYYWRVCATNAGGTSSWSNVRSFTTTIAPPSLAVPADSATGLSTSPLLRWNPPSGAQFYRVQVSTSPTFSIDIIDQGGITNSFHILHDLSNKTTYYWRVNATSASGTSDWSSVWNFTTIVHPPEVPSLASPFNGTSAASTSMTLSWNVPIGATSYQLQVATDPSYSHTFFDSSGITTNIFTVNGLSYHTIYYWRVKATNEGGISDWSPAWSFTTSNRPPRFMSAVLDTTIDEGQTIRFVIAASDSDGDPLRFTYSNFPAGATLDSISSTSRVFSWMPTYAQAGSYVDIELFVSDGFSVATSRFAITVRNVNRAPERFALVSPTGRDSIKLTFPPVPIIFRWNRAIDPDGDEVVYLVRLTGSGVDTTVSVTRDTTLSLDVMHLLGQSDVYHWYVTASDGELMSRSDTSNFRTSSRIVSAPEHNVGAPSAFDIRQNYPNPFNPSTEIVFTVPTRCHVKVAVYNVLGHVVRELADGEYAEGVYRVHWDGTGTDGDPAPSGVYFYRMTTAAASLTRKMMLVK